MVLHHISIFAPIIRPGIFICSARLCVRSDLALVAWRSFSAKPRTHSILQAVGSKDPTSFTVFSETAAPDGFNRTLTGPLSVRNGENRLEMGHASVAHRRPDSTVLRSCMR